MIAEPRHHPHPKVLIGTHGEGTGNWANRRRNQLHIRGQIDASELWRQVVSAIQDLQRDGEG